MFVKSSAKMLARSARPSPFVSSSRRMRSVCTSRSRQSMTPSLLKSAKLPLPSLPVSRLITAGLVGETCCFRNSARSPTVRKEKSASSQSLCPRMSKTELRRRSDSTTKTRPRSSMESATGFRTSGSAAKRSTLRPGATVNLRSATSGSSTRDPAFFVLATGAASAACDTPSPRNANSKVTDRHRMKLMAAEYVGRIPKQAGDKTLTRTKQTRDGGPSRVLD